MKVVITPRAEADIANQHEWGRQRFGEVVADRTFDRLRGFIETSLADHPRTGKRLSVADLYEAWVPRTPFVVFYRVDIAADTVWVVAVFHHAQQRSDFDPGADEL